MAAFGPTQTWAWTPRCRLPRLKQTQCIFDAAGYSRLIATTSLPAALIRAIAGPIGSITVAM